MCTLDTTFVAIFGKGYKIPMVFQQLLSSSFVYVDLLLLSVLSKWLYGSLVAVARMFVQLDELNNPVPSSSESSHLGDVNLARYSAGVMTMLFRDT